MKFKKASLSLLISIFLIVQLMGNFAFAQPVYAQMDAGITAAFSGKWAWEKVGKALEGAALGALVQGASYFMRKLAYDTATYVASGGKGQGALAFKQGPGAYFKSVALDSAAEAINNFAGGFGLKICQPANMQVSINIALGLRQLYTDDAAKTGGASGPSPACSWQSLKNGAASHWDTVSNPSRMFNTNFTTNGTDFGIALGAMGKIDRLQSSAVVAAQAERVEGQGFKSVTGLISGSVKEPAQIVREETTAVTAKHQGELSAGQIAGIYGSGALQIIPMAASVFLNTLTSQLLKNLMTKGILPDDSAGTNGGNAASFFASSLIDNRTAAQSAFNYIMTSLPIKQMSSLPLAETFASCEPGNIGVNNCVIDSDFQRVLEEASKSDQALTIGEALKNKLLPDRPLISPRRVVDNQDVQNCSHMGYCYSNVQKLRKARILPLGFEIAVLQADPDRPQDWLLSKVVGDGENTGFYDCPAPDKDGKIAPDTKHPFCHLIDPNWIIKVPETRCATEVYGDQLIAGTAERLSECTDWKSCVKEDINGKCLSYGYCTKEKNVWKFGAASCSSQFATCKIFTDRTGNQAAYLERSVDYGECTLADLGCKAFSTEKNLITTSTWVASIDAKGANYKKEGRNQTLYFNEKISNYSCAAAADGCSAFYKADLITDPLTGSTTYDNTYKDSNLIYLKKAPDYLGCYDINKASPGPTIEWPQTKADLNKLADIPTECNDFVKACLPEEVGCEAYAPKADLGAPTVPGIVGENFCSDQCVGYDTYKQSKNNFGPAVYPLYFVPSLGKSCQPSYQGCSEFVNLDTKAKGGEGLEYYKKIKRCEKPDILNQAVFYTWEGSAKEGYVLRVHKLKTINDNIKNTDIAGISDTWFTDNKFTYTATQAREEFVVGTPALVNTDSDHINFTESENYAYNYALCNQAKYNLRLHEPYNPQAAGPDCRAFYDREGNIFYRLLSNTITVDAACHPLRKTETDLRVDNSIHDADSCTLAKGVWGKATGGVADVCQRCYGGGEYGGGYCIYNTIAKESNSCPATGNGCREYVGNTGNKIRTVFLDEFEPTDNSPAAYTKAKEYWQGNATQQVVGESVQVGLHSLKNDQDVVGRILPTSTLKTGSWYQLSFWARGAVQSLEVQLSYQKDGATQVISFNSSATTVGLGDAWREYKIGPIQFTDVQSEPAQLLFKRTLPSGSLGAYFIDSVRLTELQDRVYLIKESWKTKEGYDAPLSCDGDPTDPLPGRALGCKAYVNSDAKNVYLTGFEKLCRDQAVGCAPVYDTFNTLNTEEAKQMNIYNAWCDLGAIANQTQECSFSTGETVSSTNKCSVEVGKRGCYLFGPLVIGRGYEISGSEVTSTLGNPWNNKNKVLVNTSTLIISADTPSSTPIYLTNYKTYRCAETNIGCMKAGAESQLVPMATTSAFAHSENYLVNNPANYKDVLCRADLVGCEQYNAGDNTYFFRDPIKNGNNLCYYKSAGTDTVGGWFLKGIGRCEGANNGLLCKSDEECGENTKCKIEGSGSEPCYTNYILKNNEQGLHSNGDWQYSGKVGICPTEQNSCTEFIDPFAKSAVAPQGEPYYILTADAQFAGCAEASQKNGCILFNQTDNPKLMYDSIKTYKLSNDHDDQGVAPQSSVNATEKNDSNILLQVKRDRDCSEWLSCKTAYNYTGADNKTIEACYELGRCVGTEPNKNCTQWVSGDDGLLNAGQYLNRDISWGGPDYSGYSLYGKYSMSNYSTMVSGEGSNKKEYIVYKDKNYQNDCSGAGKENSSCGINSVGKCLQGSCVYTIDQRAFTTTTLGVAAQCKGLPEKDSPFMPYIVKGDKNLVDKDYLKSADGKETRLHLNTKSASYGSANYCQGADDCSCSYRKVYYKNSAENDYFSPTGQILWAGIDQDGKPCDSGDTCNKIDKIETHLGSMGFCLEYDLSRPLPGLPGRFACLTWLPLDVSGSGVDVYNNNPEAGYYPALDAEKGLGQVYCTQATGKGLFARENSSLFPFNSITTLDNANDFFSRKDFYYDRADNSDNWLDHDYPDELYFGAAFKNDIGQQNGGKVDWENFTSRDTFGWYYYMKGIAKKSSPGDISGITPNQQNILDADHLNPDYDYRSYSNSAQLKKLLYSTTELWIKSKMLGKNAANSMVWYVRNPYYYGLIVDEQTNYPVGPLSISSQGNYILNLDTTLFKEQIRAIHFPELILPAIVDYPCTADDNGEKVCGNFDTYHYNFRFVASQADDNNNIADKIQINIRNLDKLAFANDERLAFGERVLLKDSYFFLDDNAEKNFWTESNSPATTDYGSLFLYPFKGVDKDENTVYGFIILLDNKFDEKNVEGQTGSADDVSLDQFNLKEVLNNYANSILDGKDGNEISDQQQIENVRAFVKFDKNGELVNGYNNFPVQWQATYDYWPREVSGTDNAGRLFGIPEINRKPGNYLDLVDNRVGMGGPDFAAVIEFEPRCTEFTSIMNSQGNSKAWTDAITQATVSDPTGVEMKRKNSFTPFGSTSLTTEHLISASNKDLFRYVFRNIKYDGMPYANNSPTWLNFVKDSSGGFPDSLHYENDDGYDSTSGANGFSWNTEGKEYIKYIFAASYNVIEQKTNSTFGNKGVGHWDESSSLGSGTPPQIYSLNPATCFKEGQQCTVGELNNFSVNQKTGVAFDYNGDKVVGASELAQAEPSIGYGSFAATTNFFAFADHNKMPLRSVKINWGDGAIQNENVNGKYKNKKPYCEYSSKFVGECLDGQKHTGLTCHTGSDCPAGQSCSEYRGHFGNLDRACDDKYFEFAHTYFCNADSSSLVNVSTLSTDTKNYLSSRGIGSDTKVCVFLPKVEVTDNWGWCNGVESTSTLAIKSAGYYGVDSVLDACGKSGSPACDCQVDNDKAWAYFKGQIIVIPQ